MPIDSALNQARPMRRATPAHSESPLDGLQDLLRVPDWSSRAACSPATAEAWWPTGTYTDNSAALRICRSCPVRRACAQYALDGGETAGIWGGVVLQGRDVRTIRKHFRLVIDGRGEPEDGGKLALPQRPNCGTEKGYYTHQRAHEPTCQPCRDAIAEYNRKRRTSKEA